MDTAEQAALERPARAAGSAYAQHVLVGSLALVVVVGIADYLTGYEVRLAILYLVPIALATWRLGRSAGILVAGVAATSWLLAFSSSHPYSHPAYFYLEGAVTGVTFVIIVLLLSRLHEALGRSDERFVTVLEGLDAAVHVADALTGDTLYSNRRFREAFRGPADLPPEDGEFCREESGAWYALHSRPLRWTDGRAATLRVAADVTEERRARELASKQRAAAHRASRLVALGEFASAIAHELNQPLAAIATYNNASLRLLESPRFDPQELSEAMRKCRDQARRAGAIIQRLREVLRQPVPTPQRVDLQEVARTVRQIALPEAAEAGVALEVIVGAPLPMARSDRLLVEQVTLNFVRNAIEAVQGLPAERRRVTIEPAPAGAQAGLWICDRGDGVPPEIEERLFEAFVTSKPGGLGLGLSICRSVVESLGGRVVHERDAASGVTRFALFLPAAHP